MTMYSPMTFPMLFLLLTVAATLLNGSPTNQVSSTKLPGHHSGELSGQNPTSTLTHPSSRENPTKLHNGHSGQTSAENPVAPSARSSGQKSEENPVKPYGSHSEQTNAEIPTNHPVYSSGEHSGENLAKPSGGDSGQTSSEYPQETASSSTNGECTCPGSEAQPVEKYPAPQGEGDAIPAIPKMPLPVSPPDAISCNPLQPGLLFAPPDWEQRPTCFYNHTCVQAACTQPSDMGASDAYWEICPLTNELMWVYLSVYNISSLTLSDEFSTDYSILRNESEFAYLEKQCTTSPAWQGDDSTKPGRFATVAYWNDAPEVWGVSRRIQLPLKVLGQDAFHFTATGFHDQSGSYAYATNDGQDPTALLTFAQFNASISRTYVGKLRAAYESAVESCTSTLQLYEKMLEAYNETVPAWNPITV